MARGDISRLVRDALKELESQNQKGTVNNIARKCGFNRHQTGACLARLMRDGKVIRVEYGLYKLDDKQLELREQKQQPDNLSELFDALTRLPDLVTNAMSSIVELAIDPELEIINMIDRRNKRITDLEVLLNQKKVESSNLRAKIDELHNNLNRLRAQKNRVIPEDVIKFRN